MGRPLMAITPTTCRMLAEYHDTCPATEQRWLRVGLVLFAAEGYTCGNLSETDMHGMFDLAFSDHDDNVRARAYELLA